MSHANAAPTPKARLRLAQLIVEHGWSVAAAAKPFMVAWTTAKRWEQRYREHGKDGINDRPSRPRTSPNRTTTSVVKNIVSLRWRKRLGPVQIAYRPGSAEGLVDTGVYAARATGSIILASNWTGVSFPSLRCLRLR